MIQPEIVIKSQRGAQAVAVRAYMAQDGDGLGALNICSRIVIKTPPLLLPHPVFLPDEGLLSRHQ